MKKARDVKTKGAEAGFSLAPKWCPTSWLQRERRLAALDAAIARGVAELDAGHGQDAEEVRKELREPSGVGHTTGLA